MLHNQQTKSFEQQVGSFEAWDLNADLFLTHCGWLRGLGNFDWYSSERHISVHTITAGRGIIETENRRKHVRAGDVFVLWPGKFTRYSEDPQNPWQYSWCHISGSKARQHLARKGYTDEKTIYPASGRKLLGMQRELREHFENKINSYDAVIYAWKCLQALKNHGSGEVQGNSMARTARAYMQSNFVNQINISSVAAYCGVNRSTLFRQFQRAFRISPSEFLQKLRLKEAENLLRNSRRKVADVALACGFSNSQYFCKVFKEKHLCTPANFRKQKR